MKIAAAITIAVLLNSTALPAEPMPVEKWESIGEQRITCYCPYCNDGEGHESSSGKELEYGDCACSWLPIGTKISVEGEIFVVRDICGTEAIDIFIDHDDGYCGCRLNEYRQVSVLQ